MLVTTPTPEIQMTYNFQLKYLFFSYYKSESYTTDYILIHAQMQREIKMASQKMQGHRVTPKLFLLRAA